MENITEEEIKDILGYIEKQIAHAESKIKESNPFATTWESSKRQWEYLKKLVNDDIGSWHKVFCSMFDENPVYNGASLPKGNVPIKVRTEPNGFEEFALLTNAGEFVTIPKDTYEKSRRLGDRVIAWRFLKEGDLV